MLRFISQHNILGIQFWSSPFCCSSNLRNYFGLLIQMCFSTSRTSYTIDESSASSSDTMRSTVVTTLGTTASHKSKQQVNYGCPQHHQQRRDGDYDTVVVIDENRWCRKDYATSGLQRPISCSNLYETIPESSEGVNKFPMHIMHSNKTCK